MGFLSCTRPAVGAANLAADVGRFLDEIEMWSNTIDGTNIAAVPAHAPAHAVGQPDALDALYVPWGSSTPASGLVLRCAFRATCQDAPGNPAGLIMDYEKGQPVTLNAKPAAGQYEFTFAGMGAGGDYVVQVTVESTLAHERFANVESHGTFFRVNLWNGTNLAMLHAPTLLANDGADLITRLHVVVFEVI